MSDISVCREMSQNGTTYAAFGSMWQKVCSWACAVVLAGYLLALCGLAISGLRKWMAEPPEPPAVARVQSHWIMVNSNSPMPTNLVATNLVVDAKLIDVSWRCSRRVLNQYNTEHPHHWVNLDDGYVSEILGLLGTDRLTTSEWLERAKEHGIAKSSFYRRLEIVRRSKQADQSKDGKWFRL